MSKRPVGHRKCIACGGFFAKDEMQRVAKIKSGEIVLDASGTCGGRGAYACKSKACLSRVCDKGLLNRFLRTRVSEGIYEELIKEDTP